MQSKAEVRFQDKNLVRNTIIHALKKAIKQSMHRSTYDTKIVDYLKKSTDDFKHHSLQEKKSNFDFTTAHNTSSTLPEKNLEDRNKTFVDPTRPVMTETHSLFESKVEEKPLGMACFQLHDTYIVSITDDSLIVTDQHAAHERLVYESLKLSKKIEKQCLIVPEMLEYDSAAVELLMNYACDLQELGLIIEKMGDQAVIVREIPAVLGNVDVKLLMQDILDTISAFGTALSLEKKLEDIYGTFACHHSIRAGRKLNVDEMNEILRQMESTPLTGQCNHGRPTHIKLKKTDIEKLFERR